MAKILIVDNDPDIVESIKVTLEAKDYETVVASSGEEGIKKVESEKPDLIILDVMMETIDKGFEVCRTLKGNPDTKEIPIILLTAIKELPDMDFSLGGTGSAGSEADYFCEKPIAAEDLLEKVEKLIK